MKLKRLILLILIFSMAGAVTVFADDALKWYKGKNVKVVVNGSELKTPGLLIEGTTFLPLRDIADTLQAIVTWNGGTQTVNMYKPNVHITLVQKLKNDGYVTFGQVVHESKYDFNIFTQVDSVLTKVHSFKITIVDPNGNEIYDYEDVLKERKESMWLFTPDINREFKHLGKYTVKVYMKINEADDYFLVSEKIFLSIGKQ